MKTNSILQINPVTFIYRGYTIIKNETLEPGSLGFWVVVVSPNEYKPFYYFTHAVEWVLERAPNY